MLTISIIVPIYKVEKYLNECIDSLLIQTYKNIEIILVDDGSPDNCGEICDTYKNRDSRIKVIYKQNGGLSDARNAGLNIATGDYIAFLDADDYYYDNNCISDIVKQLNCTQPDILLIPNILYYDDDEKYVYKNKHYDRSKIFNVSKYDALEYALKYDFFKACAWDKIVKRSIIEQSSLCFKKGVLSEDIDWTAHLLVNSETFDCIERPIYVYRQRKASITKTINCKHVIDILKQIEYWSNYSGDCDKNIINGYLAHNFVMLMEVFGRNCNILKNKDIINEIKRYDYLLKFDYSLNVSKVKKVYKIFGFYITLFILKIYRR